MHKRILLPIVLVIACQPEVREHVPPPPVEADDGIDPPTPDPALDPPDDLPMPEPSETETGCEHDCAAGGMLCERASDCDGLYCVRGSCELGEPGSPCETDDDCTVGECWELLCTLPGGDDTTEDGGDVGEPGGDGDGEPEPPPVPGEIDR